MPQEILAVLLALAAATCWASASIFVRIGLQGISSSTGTFLSLVVGWIIIALLALIFYRGEFSTLPAIAFLWFLVAGVINFPVGRYFNFTSVSLAGVARATPILSTSPLVAAILAIIFLGEALTLPIALGTLAIIGGVILVMTSRSDA